MLKNPFHAIFWIFILIISLFTLSASVYTVFFIDRDQDSLNVTVVESKTPEIIESAPKTTTLMFVGDIMFDRGVESSVNRNFDGDFTRLFDNLEIFEKADVLFGNLEGPVSDTGTNRGSKYSFRMDPQTISALKDGGFDVLSFANNHVGDYGQEAFEDTLTRLTATDILFTGAGWNKRGVAQPTVLEVGDLHIGFLGFTDVGPSWMVAGEDRAGILLANDPNFTDIITDADEQVDMLITSFHWGDEYVPFNNRQQSLAHAAIDAGADIVVGHHPHVVQDTEMYNNKLIAYSLGNFVFDQYFSNETMEGMLLEVLLEDGEVMGVNKHIMELDRTYQPIVVRPLQEEDIVKADVQITALCPEISQWHPDRVLFPVNREHSLGQYEPQRLTHMPNRIETRGTATCLDPETADAVEQMFQAMNSVGLSPVMTSGYRDYDTQQHVYNDWLKRQKGIIPEFPSVAEPGHSEHQLGTTIDVKSLQTDEFTYDDFGDSPEYIWMQQHAHTFGFVQSYQEKKESITGYIAEPWHWRYIGVDRAIGVQTSKLTLNEFLLEHTELTLSQ
jgi:poly-gamma-glutamate synthesis protein (capsule biosynthesis protein)